MSGHRFEVVETWGTTRPVVYQGLCECGWRTVRCVNREDAEHFISDHSARAAVSA